MDAAKRALSLYVFNTIQGVTFPTWLRLLADNGFRVHPRYIPRAAFMTLASLGNSAYAAGDALLFGRRVRQTRVEAPVFILGHFRGGTTHLHNLLALDRRFAYPTLYQTINPSTFLGTEDLCRLPARLLMIRHRPQDGVPIDPTVPAEDEVALAAATLASPYLGWAFPRRQDVYDRYLTLRDVPRHEVERWKAGLRGFLQKVSWKHGGRPLLLKSPPHTARVRLLLELFPDARFIHIHRDPFEVFLSTRRLLTMLPPYFALQDPNPDPASLDDRIIRQYARMYDAFFDDRPLIPPGQFSEVAYADLERDPMNVVASIYDDLDLPDFDEAAPDLRRYLATVSDYRKNRHPDLPITLRARLARDWRRCFEAWGYPTGIGKDARAA